MAIVTQFPRVMFSCKVCPIKTSGFGCLGGMKKTFVISNGERNLLSCQVKQSERKKLRREKVDDGKVIISYFLICVKGGTFLGFYAEKKEVKVLPT